MMSVTLYTSPTCGYCHQAKMYLAKKDVKYIERDVSVDKTSADEIMKLTGQMGVPVIVIDGQPVVGFNQPRLDQLLADGNGSSRLRFGLKIADASAMAQRDASIPVLGAYVGRVAPGSPGQLAGLMTGDVITELNMRPVNKASDLEKALKALTAGSNMLIVFTRGSNSLKAEVKV
jgi:glutaredoxin 3